MFNAPKSPDLRRREIQTTPWRNRVPALPICTSILTHNFGVATEHGVHSANHSNGIAIYFSSSTRFQLVWFWFFCRYEGEEKPKPHKLKHVLLEPLPLCAPASHACYAHRKFHPKPAISVTPNDDTEAPSPCEPTKALKTHFGLLWNRRSVLRRIQLFPSMTSMRRVIMAGNAEIFRWAIS